MRRRPRWLLLALLPLAPALAAQERPVLRLMPEPLPPGAVASSRVPLVERITYDVASGELRDRRAVSLDTVPQGALALGTACFDNSDLGACGMQFASPWTIGDLPGDELLDWGVKICGGSKMVQSLTIGYRTTELDVADGGPGATLSFGLYRGTLGWNRVGTEVFRRTFTGLPGQRAPNNDPHGAPFVFVTIDFGAQPLFLPDGPIGWGYMLLDNDSTIATGPLLVKAPSPTTSVVDALDVFQPGPASTGVYKGTFNFGTQCNHGPPCCPDASTWLQIVEAPLGATVMNGSGVNPSVFSELIPARLGQGWVTAFDLSARPSTGLTMILLSRSSLAPPRASRLGEVLSDPQGWFGPISLGKAIHVVPIPNTTALAGTSFFAQGVLQSGTGRQLTNALEVPVGP